MTIKEWKSYKDNDSVFVIDYQSPSGKGKMVIDTKYFYKIQKKFNRLFKDCAIISFTEYPKGGLTINGNI